MNDSDRRLAARPARRASARAEAAAARAVAAAVPPAIEAREVREVRAPAHAGSPFVRLLATIDGLDAAPGEEGFAQGLSRWLPWRDAIALAAVLDAPAAMPAPTTPAAAMPDDAPALARDLRRLRAAIAQLAAGAPPSPGHADARRRLDGVAEPVDTHLDDADALREHVARVQQAMSAKVDALRERVRAALAAASPALARVASLDAVLAPAVDASAQVLLDSVGPRLARHVERLRRGAGDGWRAVAQRDLQALLLAELELRLQPVEGLVAALARP